MTGFSACLFAVLTALPQMPSEPARVLCAGERLGGSFDLMPQTSDNERTLDAVFGAVPSQDIFHPFTKSYDE